MADLGDEYGNPMQLTDQYGNPVQLKDEYGNPMQLSGVAITALCCPFYWNRTNSSLLPLEPSNFRSSFIGLAAQALARGTSTTVGGQQHEKKSMVEKIMEKLPGHHDTR
uniref:Dehydrin-like protein n=1 Tax=Fagopyrum esculentum TaxID=3617 RepID=G0T5Q6_FAGES|nr:dehydrin-like protein [Fagopyrum esculentum]